MSKNILVVAPHPDDEVLGVAGTIIKRTKQHHKVFICIVTRCRIPSIPEEVVKRGREECKAVSKMLNAQEPIFLDFPANELSTIPVYKIADAINKIILGNSIDEVYVPHYGDAHSDHRIVFDACIVAARPKGKSYPGRVCAYETVSETGWNAPTQHNEFIPNVYEDISDEIEKKLEAVSTYKSQLQVFPDARSLGTVEALARYRGSTVGVKAAEAFELIREIRRK